MNVMRILNYICISILLLTYIYQLFVILFIKNKKVTKYKNHKFAILIAARNEENVVGNLIESIQLQDYPSKLIDIFVVADNCTDLTAEIARKKGAMVFERHNKEKIGKGYALDFLIKKIKDEYKNNKYDAFIVFDADNLVDRCFITEMNKIYSNGYEVVTCYRNSKNYDDSWISAGSSILFFQSSLFLKYKMLKNISGKVSGTGFLISNKVLELYGGWKFYTLAEDMEFSMSCRQNNIKIGYSDLSVIYDEQPVKFSEFWKQRIRWTKGYMQALKQNTKKIKISAHSPDTITISTISMTFNFIIVLIYIIMLCINIKQIDIYRYIKSIGELLIYSYAIVFINGLITTIVEWNKIRSSGLKKIIYSLTFPFIIACYVPIPFICLFKRNIKWDSIKHNNNKNIEMMR